MIVYWRPECLQDGKELMNRQNKLEDLGQQMGNHVHGGVKRIREFEEAQPLIENPCIKMDGTGYKSMRFAKMTGTQPQITNRTALRNSELLPRSWSRNGIETDIIPLKYGKDGI